MTTQTVSHEQLKSVIERIENLEEHKKEIVEDMKSVYDEAKNNGYDIKVIRKIVRERARDAAERIEERQIFETYANAIGMSV